MNSQKQLLIPDRKFLSGGGQMGELIRSIDWSKTALGDVKQWPQSLRTSVSVCLNSKFPILIWWGTEMTMIYNDAYRPILGKSKHPKAMGAPGKEVWEEIWNIIGPMLNGVLEDGNATWSENQLLLLDRNGYPEECYFTFSYSPIYDESGTVGGIFCAVTETTDEVIGSRHLTTLRELGSTLNDDPEGEDQIYDRVMNVIGRNQKDFPFSVLYKFNDQGTTADLVDHVVHYPTAPKEINVHSKEWATWRFDNLLKTRKAFTIPVDSSTLAPSARGAWDLLPSRAFVLPISRGESVMPFAALITGVNPHAVRTEKYKSFFSLCADQIAKAISNARAYDEERQRASALEELDKAKTAFFSNISHEFRTPLTLMLGPLEELLNQQQHDALAPYRETLAATHRNAMRLLRLVNTLLDFSRIEAGRYSANYQPANLAAVTKDLTSNFRSMIESAGLVFKLQLDQLSDLVYIDYSMWEKIVLNLLSNAFKFTLNGEIAVSITEQDGHAILAVADTGVGIPGEEMPNMFKRFHRVRNHRGRSFEGTGIGLSLVKELVECHGGDIQVRSNQGTGTTFTIRIPMGKDHLPAPQVSATPPERFEPGFPDVLAGELRSMIANSARPERYMPHQEISSNGKSHHHTKVLVVDDNADMREYIQRLLAPWYTVSTASNGQVALELIRKEAQDVIISDIMMPVMDGIELLDAVRADPKTRGIPLILLSARAGEEARIEGFETGADDYLIKPFSAKELVARVKAQINLAEIKNKTSKQLGNVFSQAPVAITILKGPQFAVEYVNPLMLNLWGKTLQQVWMKPIIEALPEIKGQKFMALLRSVYETGERFVSQEHLVTLERNGVLENVYISFNYVALTELDGSISGVIAVAHEVTDLVLARKKTENISQELEEKVKERTAELEKKNQELEQFAYISSHDLQEPLRKIKTFTDLLARNLHDKDVAERYAVKIDTAASRMSSLINSILTYSKLRGKSNNFALVDLNNSLEIVRDDLEILIAQKQGTIHVGPLPTIHADPLQIQQLFSNLITNALKFCSSRPVINIQGEINVDQRPQDTGRNYARISVTDNGIGFDNQYSDRIFGMFQRLNNRSEYEGTGIGLALCKKIVENHDGHIHVTSKVGVGTTFNIYFPDDPIVPTEATHR